MTRRLTGVGVGPGDPELLTVKAVRLLARVPVVFHPSGGIARAIAAPHLDPRRQELVALPERSAAAAGRIVAARLAACGEAAYLTEGDPLLYGSFTAVATAAVAADPSIELAVVPGVPAFGAVAAALGGPLVQGGERLAIVTGGGRVEEALRGYETVAVHKAGRDLEGTLAALARTGRTADAVLVTRCGQPGESVVTDVRALAGRRLDYFSLLLVRRRGAAAP